MSTTKLYSRAALHLLAVAALCLVPRTASAQTNYCYLPTPSAVDGRMFSVAGGNLKTLGDNPLVFEVAVPASFATLELGVFDGETGGIWDQGATPLEYTLYADPEGDGVGSLQVGQWRGDSMVNNGWYNITINNSPDARCGNSDFFYTLKVRSTNAAEFQWSSFKLRTNGTIVVRGLTNLAYTAPLGSALDAQAIYPSFPVISPTNYDGIWRFFINVPERVPQLEIWDGDIDRGSYDCSDNDTDDPNTSNVVPAFATGSARPEGIPDTLLLPCTNAAGTAIGGLTTSNPADDSRGAFFVRPTGVSYEVIAPDGVHYANNNPSGNLEWERFVLSTAPFDNSVMDHHADSLPAGIYELRITGVDLSNLNAFRFPYEVTGVDSAGNVIAPLRPGFTDGTITGLLYYENGGDRTQSSSEPGIPSVAVLLLADYNNDGAIDATFTTETDADGNFLFSALTKGVYTVKVDTATLSPGTEPVWDTDSADVNISGCSLSMCSRTSAVTFGYQTPLPPVGTRTRGYWVNHPEDWPVTSLTLGSTSYTKAELIGILKRPTRGDQTYSLAAQLIAAKLNIAAGSISTCITATVANADALLSTYPVGSQLKNNSTASSLTGTLDDYNNGRMCAGHMD